MFVIELFRQVSLGSDQNYATRGETSVRPQEGPEPVREDSLEVPQAGILHPHDYHTVPIFFFIFLLTDNAVNRFTRQWSMASNFDLISTPGLL